MRRVYDACIPCCRGVAGTRSVAGFGSKPIVCERALPIPEGVGATEGMFTAGWG